MEFLRVSKSQSIISTVLHVVFNIALAATIFFIIYISRQIEVALLLVLISKWRIFAVRIRYWGANLLANIVDITVGCSLVGLMYLAGQSGTQMGMWVQVGVAVFYALWLIAIKPLSGERAMLTQAAIGLFLGMWIVIASAHVLAIVPFLTEFLLCGIGYGASRHILSAYNEPQSVLLSLIFGLMVAELGWLASHWAIGYHLHMTDQFRLPQAAIIAVLLGLVCERFYAAARAGQSMKRSEYAAPIIFSAVTVVIMLVFFSSAVNV